MKHLTRKRIGIFATLLFFLIFATVKAATGYSVTEYEMDVSAFPAVKLKLKVSGETNGLAARNIAIQERGHELNGPLIWLPPALPTNKIDLVILRDRSENAARYEEVIQNKLDELMNYFEEKGVEVTVHLNNSESGTSRKVDGLKRISDLAAQSTGAGAEKILLILNATPFNEGGNETTNTISATVGKLAEKGFKPFVVGYPFRSLHSPKSAKTNDNSLSHAIPGGYLGSFSSDLTILYDLLQGRDISHFTLYYTSDLMPSEASGASVSFFVFGNAAGSFNYPSISTAQPVITHLTGSSVMSGEALPIQVEVDPAGKMVSEVELSYRDKNGDFQTNLLKVARSKSTPDALIFEGTIPEGDYSEKGVDYYAKVYTPYDEVGGGGDMVNVDVQMIDDGITLTPTLVNKKEVLWHWKGKTVDMGTQFEIWSGDELIKGGLTDRYYTIPITECDRYQSVRVRALLKKTADHPRAGDWSLFSRPVEYYYGDESASQDSFTEAFGVGKMVECLKKSAYKTTAAFIVGQKGYKPAGKLTLNRTLYYLTAILKQTALSEARSDRYGLLYLFMDYISQEDYDTFDLSGKLIPVKLLYKVIALANQTTDLDILYKDSMNELSIRLRGNTSI
ncbi:MAG: hypothetical protein V1880_01785 [Patescibacteria group bacterium]